MELLIEVTKPTIYQNFDEVKKDLITKTKVYEIEVTVDNLTEAKKAGADINKIKSELKAKAKEYIDVMEEPIKQFKSKLKELEKVLDGRRELIVSQVSVFEDVKRADHVTQMTAYLLWLQEEHGLDLARAKKLDVHPFASVAGLTQAGKLNKKSREQVEGIFKAALGEQKTAEIEAENKRLRDEARAEEILRKRAEDAQKAVPVETTPEHTEEVPAQINEVAPQAEKSYSEVVTDRKPKETASLPPQGKSVYRIVMTYEITAQAGVPVDIIGKKVIPMIKAGEVPAANIDIEEVTYDIR